MRSAIDMNAGLHELATASPKDCVPCPAERQHLIRSPLTSRLPLQLNVVLTVTAPVSSADASVMTLNVEPGS